MKNLSEKAIQAKKIYDDELISIFQEFKAKNPEVAGKVLNCWDDELDASTFMAKPCPMLDGKSSYEAVEAGEQENVLGIIDAIVGGHPA